jgi:hypothetical protein
VVRSTLPGGGANFPGLLSVSGSDPGTFARSWA